MYILPRRRDGQGVDEPRVERRGRFELVRAAGPSARGRARDRHAPNGGEGIEERVDAPRVPRVAHGRQMHERREQVRHDAEEGVHVELLIRPVILRAKRQPERIFERPEHAFDHGLAAVGSDDLGGRPLVLVGHEHEPAEPLALEAIERGVVDRVGERQGLPAPVEADVEQLAQVLAPEPLGHLGLNRSAGAPLFAARERGLEGVEPAHRFGEMLFDAAALPLLQARRHEHDERALRAPHEPPRAIDLHRLVGTQREGRELGHGLGDQDALARRRERGHIMEGQRVDRRLGVFGDVPFVIDHRDAFEVAAERDEALAELREHVGKHAHVRARAAVDLMEEWDRRRAHPPARAAERDTHLSQVVALLLVVPACRECGAGVGGGEKGEEVGGVVEDGVQREREVGEHTPDEGSLDRGQGRDGDAVHLIPEVLAREPRDIDAREVAQRGGRRPPGEAAFTRRVAGAAHGGERQRLPHGEAIVLRGAGARRHLRIDERREVERARELPHGGDGAVGPGRHLDVLGLRERLQGLVGAAQMAKDAELGASGDGIAEGLDDPEVAVALSRDDLKARHAVVYTLSTGKAQAPTWHRHLCYAGIRSMSTLATDSKWTSVVYTIARSPTRHGARGKPIPLAPHISPTHPLSRETHARSLSRWALRSVPLGKYCRSSPLVFSLVPRCHGLCGSQK